MGFFNYVMRRFALALPTLFGVSVICFTLTYLLPGNPAMVKAGPFATPEHLAEMEHQMGLDRPFPEQYYRYVSGIFKGDLGESASTGRPVSQDFLQRLPATLELNLASLLIAIVIGLPLGVLSAVHRDTLIDHIGRVVGIMGVAMPSFLTGLLFVYVFFYMLNMAPSPLGRLGSGIEPPAHITGLYVIDSLLTGNWTTLRSSLHQLMLPAATLGLSAIAPVARMVRSTMLEILESDYIKAAWAAGLPRRTVIYRDALRNALIPVITISGIVFGFLMAGNAVVESVFSWPGIGNYAVTALLTKDSAPIQSFILFVAVTCVMVNLAVDIAYGLVDPRIRFS
ncbi:MULTISPECIES: ABC transporter permease [unclassified Bradyrhizobium]|uniref:ABC transporter permease n=1 Tax=unclassified Bradyrhizobium TaxID=2631580 RepID=UPI001CD1B606|nr:MULTISPECIES: ABC transporter permease [unclassified Bradyrhizobium]MCA1386417.1 ABC transporter permease [Bradyrhizobium sp. BRP05]MCA1394520.1 ABC transporter permease [Bradyrhizobium sp. IC3123]MCA1424013.1 ABC transporter permease [Bradyrhizobium sp. BRP23]MCA1431035.1 ABC transporter permease [Bradyrhizobium sp. NBAIM16]MCA1436372.1 ABC transporter permease [Bradyrhizobium sp. BRP20]